MSCYYKALPRLIPQLMLMARPGSEIMIVSPWIDNIVLHPPIFNTIHSSALHLGEIMTNLALAYEIHFTLLFRDQDHRLRSAIKSISAQAPRLLTLQKVSNLHAKMIVIDTFALEMSANLLPTSLYRNVESCALLVNNHRDAREYVENKLSLII
jgi:hypothetical protein